MATNTKETAANFDLRAEFKLVAKKIGHQIRAKSVARLPNMLTATAAMNYQPQVLVNQLAEIGYTPLFRLRPQMAAAKIGHCEYFDCQEKNTGLMICPALNIFVLYVK